MVNFPQKSVVRVAAKKKVTMNLSQKHTTSLGFGQLCPVYINECVPGDKFKITPNYLAQVAPLYKPAFADVKVNLRAFFVPHRLVWPQFEDFISNNRHFATALQATLPSFVPYITAEEICQFCTDTDYAVNSTTVPTGGYDVIIYDFQNSVHRYVVFNEKGRFYFKIFEMLGYILPINSDNPLDRNRTYSALPLLAFFKIFLDWYTPSQFQNSNPIHGIINWMSQADGSQGGTHLSYEDTANGISIKTLFDNFELAVSNDYFTSSWVSQNSPSGDGTQNFQNYTEQLSPIDETRGSIDVSTSSTTLDFDNAFSQISIDLLNKFHRFITRNNLAGSRVVERILARFGVRVPDERLRFAEYIGSVTSPLNIMQVVNQGGELSELGEYAGRALISGSGRSFEYDVKEYGYIFVLASMQVDSTFVDGYPRYLRHLQPLDFYTPEFDGQTPQAIDTREIFSRFYGGTDQTSDDLQMLLNGQNRNYTFGFTRRYAEYKFGLDRLTGDANLRRFRLPMKYLDYSRRLVKDVTDETLQFYFNPNSKLSVPKVLYQNDREQWNRIFNVTSNTPDPFYFIFNFDIKAQRPMLPINDSFELPGGNELEMDTNGTKMS